MQDIGHKQPETRRAKNTVDRRDGGCPREEKGPDTGTQTHGRHLRRGLAVLLKRVEVPFGLRDQSPVVAADLLDTVQELDVLERVAQQGGEGQLTQDEEGRKRSCDKGSERETRLSDEPAC